MGNIWEHHRNIQENPMKQWEHKSHETMGTFGKPMGKS